MISDEAIYTTPVTWYDYLRNRKQMEATVKMLAAAHSRNYFERPGDCGRSGCGHRHYDEWRGAGGARIRRRIQRARENRNIRREIAVS